MPIHGGSMKSYPAMSGDRECPEDHFIRENSSFFQEATLRICGQLNIEDLLWESMKFLGKYIPADEMMLNIYSPEEGYLRVLAQATTQKGQQMNKLIPLSYEVRKLVQLNCSKEKIPNDRILIINRPNTHTVAHFLCSSMSLVRASIMTMFIFVDKRHLGVVDMIAKDNNIFSYDHARIFSLLQNHFRVAVANALTYQRLIEPKNQDNKRPAERDQEPDIPSVPNIIGARSGLKDVMNSVSQVASKDSTVLISGQTGVGKEVIARAIHQLSPRKKGPFVKVNCGAIPENLVDSELFGHEKGAFTGAVALKRGRFELAHTGTVLLDEIGELPLQAQVRLLHILQHKEVERVGGTKFIPVDIRIIAATHRDLKTMVYSGQFRQDLWYRLNIFPIHIPALKERKEDISALVRHIVDTKCQKLGFKESPRVSKQCLESLTAYDWPGNIRELENMIERELIKNDGHIYSLIDGNENQTYNPEESSINKLESLDQAMFSHIQKALKYTQGKIHGPNGAAELLEIHPNTLRHRMKKLGISFKNS